MLEEGGSIPRRNKKIHLVTVVPRLWLHELLETSSTNIATMTICSFYINIVIFREVKLSMEYREGSVE